MLNVYPSKECALQINMSVMHPRASGTCDIHAYVTMISVQLVRLKSQHIYTWYIINLIWRMNKAMELHQILFHPNKKETS